MIRSNPKTRQPGLRMATGGGQYKSAAPELDEYGTRRFYS